MERATTRDIDFSICAEQRYGEALVAVSAGEKRDLDGRFFGTSVSVVDR